MNGIPNKRLKSSKTKTVKTCIDNIVRTKKKKEKEPVDNETRKIAVSLRSVASFFSHRNSLSSSSKIAASVFRKWLITIASEGDRHACFRDKPVERGVCDSRMEQKTSRSAVVRMWSRARVSVAAESAWWKYFNATGRNPR